MLQVLSLVQHLDGPELTKTGSSLPPDDLRGGGEYRIIGAPREKRPQFRAARKSRTFPIVAMPMRQVVPTKSQETRSVTPTEGRGAG